MKRIYETLLSQHHRENRQMAFLTGARQVGKTTSCKKLYKHAVYINWDNINDRAAILKGPQAVAEKIKLHYLRTGKLFLIFDEIHKYSKWKDFLKGFFDTYNERIKITVTGSARLDMFRKGGDSLMGRYFLYHMHPLSIGELVSTQWSEKEIRLPKKISQALFKRFWMFGGFPEPFIKANIRFSYRWQKSRLDQLLREDIRNLTKIYEADQVLVLARLIASHPGQLVNYSNLAQEINVAVNTIRHWIAALRALYFCFEIKPWYKNIAKSLRKQPKIYLWDWSVISDDGAKYENFVASHLLKAVHWWTDIGLGEYGLYYVRDKQHKEVDFLVVRNGVPWFLVEAKASVHKSISDSLFYFHKCLKTQHAFQVVRDMDYVHANCFKESNPMVVPAKTFLSQLV